jgi:tRNA A58 N-methylase Trm61
MLELGAYWGHYSMWCQSKIPKAKLFLVEPEKNHLEIAQKNFAENELFATFICGFVGKGHFTVDQFMENQKLTKLNILHSDIQGFEVEMLQDAKHSLSSHMIDYCFVSTHNEVLHLECVKTLEEYGYCVTVSAGFDTETTSCDGFILASSPRVKTVLEDFWFFTREQCGSVSLTELKKFLSQFEH